MSLTAWPHAETQFAVYEACAVHRRFCVPLVRPRKVPNLCSSPQCALLKPGCETAKPRLTEADIRLPRSSQNFRRGASSGRGAARPTPSKPRPRTVGHCGRPWAPRM